MVIDLNKLDWIDVLFPPEQKILKRTLRAGRITGRGHVYFKFTDKIVNWKFYEFGIEILGEGVSLEISIISFDSWLTQFDVRSNHRIILPSLRYAAFTQPRLLPCGHCRCCPGDGPAPGARAVAGIGYTVALTHLVFTAKGRA